MAKKSEKEGLLARVGEANRTDPRRSLRIVESALAAAPRGGDRNARLERARLIRYRAHARRALNDFAGSLTDYRLALRAFDRLGETNESAITRIGEVSALFYRGRHDEALESARRARVVFRRTGDRVRLARLDTNTGNIFHRLDRPAEALAWYDRARRVFARLDDADGLALVDLNRGNALVLLGRVDEARTAYRAARSHFAARGQDLAVAEPDYGLAYLLFMENRLTEALAAFEELRPRLERLQERRLLALSDMDSAETNLRLNLWEEAVERAERASRLFRALEMRYEEARSSAFAGMAHVRLGHGEKGLAAWRRAALLFEREGNRTWQGILLLMMARAERSAGRLKQAMSHAREARTRLGRGAPPAARAEADYLLAVLVAESARGGAARARAGRLLDSVRREAKKLGADWLVRDTEEALGELARVEGRTQAARRHLMRAVEAGERLRSLLGPDDFQAAFFRDRSHPYLSLARLELDAGRYEAAYDWIERGRSRALLEGIEGLPRARDVAEPARRDELEAILRRLAAHYQPTHAFASSTRPATGLDRLPDRLRRHLESRADQLVSRFCPVGRPAGDSVQGRRSVPGAPFADPRLRADEAIVSYFENEGAIHAFVETADGLSLAPNLAARDDLARAADRLRWQWGRFRLGADRFSRHARLLLDDALEDLSLLHAWLIEPLERAAGRRNWILIPTGVMADLPFAAFYDGRHFFVESHRLALTPGRSVFAVCRARLSRPGSGTLLVGQVGPGTPEVEEELAALERHSSGPTELLVGRDATVGALLAALPGKRRVHLASHGFFHADRPRLSGIRLADRWLHAADLAGLSLDAELVTLSACQSGTSLVRSGDEWMGLPRAFLRSGAARVLASLWDVDDRATRELMSRFAAESSIAGIGPAEALGRAQIELLSETRHPYFWAGFEILGTP